jgi:6-phosphofructokinase 1
MQAISRRADAGRPYSLVVAAEGAMTKSEAAMKKSERAAKRNEAGVRTAADSLVKLIGSAGFESRGVVPGHYLRGGTPSAADRLLSTQYGVRAAELLHAEKYGYTAARVGGVMTENRLADMAGKSKLVDVGGEVIRAARRIGTVFGE